VPSGEADGVGGAGVGTGCVCSADGEASGGSCGEEDRGAGAVGCVAAPQEASSHDAVSTAPAAAADPRRFTAPIMPTPSHYAAAVPDDTATSGTGPLRVLLLTGGVGTGKTTTAVEIGALLDARAEPSSVIDLDQLCWITPDERSGMGVPDVLHASLAAILPVHLRAGVRRLVLPRLLLAPADVDSLRVVLAGWEAVVVELTATDTTRAARIAGRDSGSTLAGHLDELGALVPSAGLADHAVATDGRDVQEVAAEVLRWWDAASP